MSQDPPAEPPIEPSGPGVFAPVPQWAPPPGYAQGWESPVATKLTGDPVGIVPLRPLCLGDLIDGAVRAMRHNPRVMFGLSAIIALLSATVSAVAQLLGLNQFAEIMSSAESTSFSTDQGVSAASGLVGSVLLPGLLTAAALVVLSGLLTIAVADAVIGRKPSIAQVFARIGGRGILRILGLTLVLGLGGVLLFALCAGPVVALAFWQPWVAGVVGLILLLALFVVGIYVIPVTSFAAPVLLLERTGIFAALARSWRLVRGSYWRSLGILLLTSLIGIVASGVVQTPFSAIGIVIAGLGADASSSITSAQIISTVISSFGAALASAVVTPFTTGVTALLYLDLRIRREGLDVSLAEAARRAP